MTRKLLLTIENALQRGFHLLSRKMHTTWELQKKLREEGFPEELIEETLAILRDRGYLDDRTYMYAYIEEKRRVAPKGYFAFYHELKRRGIPGAILGELRNMYTLEDEIEDAKRLLSTWKAKGHEKEKFRRRLLGRGFSQEAIERAILDLPNSGD